MKFFVILFAVAIVTPFVHSLLQCSPEMEKAVNESADAISAFISGENTDINRVVAALNEIVDQVPEGGLAEDIQLIQSHNDAESQKLILKAIQPLVTKLC